MLTVNEQGIEKPINYKTSVSAKDTSKYSSLVFKLLFFGIMIFSLMVGINTTSIVKNATHDADAEILYIEKWTVYDSEGKSFTSGRSYTNKRAYKEDFTLISQLPDKIPGESLLCFQNRGDVRVYVNGELRKEFIRSRDTYIPGGSLKEFYVIIPLEEEDAGAELKLVRGRTEWNPQIVPVTVVSTISGVYNYLLGKYGIPFALEIMLFVAALLVTIVGVVLRIWNKHKIDMLYGALGVLNVACWLLAVSQLTPFVTRIYYVDGLMGFLFCMMMPFALLIYIDSIQHNRYRKLYSVLFIMSMISFFFWTAIHFSGIRSFQSSLVFIDSELALIVVSVLVTLGMDIKNGHIKEYPYTAAGFIAFMIMSIVEIIMLIFFESISNEIPMLIGLLFLLILVSIQQIDDIKNIRSRLEEEVKNNILEKEQMLIHIVQTLAGTIDAKDTYTNGHSSRVAEYSKEIARRYGYSESDLNDIYMMGLLHDIGKIGVPDVVINKPGKLSSYEYSVIKEHPVVGANILQNIEEKKELAMGARWHHERYDGKGYPDGIKGDKIPEQARIIAVADAYDAMTSYRSYRDPMPQERVMKEIAEGSGSQFDPRFAKIMMQMIIEDSNYDLREKKDDKPSPGKA